MTELGNPFDNFDHPEGEAPPIDAATYTESSAPAYTADAAAMKPKEPNPFDEFATPDVMTAHKPTTWESISQNFMHGTLFGETKTGIDIARAQKTISKAETSGTAEVGDSPFSGKPSDSEYRNAQLLLENAANDRQQWDDFHSEGVKGKAAAILGGLAGAIVDPANLILAPIAGAAKAAIEVGLLSKMGWSALSNGGQVAAKAAGWSAAGATYGASADLLSQGIDIGTHQQTEFDAKRLAYSTALGAAFGVAADGTMHFMPSAMKYISTLIKDYHGELPEQAQHRLDMADRTAEINALPQQPKATTVPPDGQVVPELHPAVQIAREASAEVAAQPAKKYSPDIIPDKPNAVGAAGKFEFDPTTLKTDAEKFQYKDNGDENGVTSRLQGVKKWDDSKSGMSLIWQDKDGQNYVADGHQRVGLANRLATSGDATPKSITGLLYREADGISADDMRAIAAAKNISEGSGTAIDAAKILRQRPELLDGSLPISEGKGRQAASLARLDDDSFRMVINDVVPENHAAIVGDLIPKDAARQNAAMKAIARFKPKNEDEVFALTQRVIHAELEKAHAGAQGSMFGDLESAGSTAGEEMKIVAHAIGELKKDKTLFKRVTSNADRIEQTGSKIERDSASKAVHDSEVFAKLVGSEAYSSGTIRDALKVAAKDVKNGTKSISDAAKDLYASVRERAERGMGEGDGASRNGAGTITERTSAGDQTLAPGVEPITDKQRLDLQASKPLKGGNEPMKEGMFDENARNQSELFMARQKAENNFDPNTHRPNRANLPGQAETGTGKVKLTDKEVREFKRDGEMRDIAKSLGLGFEHKRTSGGALGSFKPGENILRVRHAGDVEVFSHELGHAIDARLANNPDIKGDWNDLIRANAKDLLNMDLNAKNSGSPPNIAEGVAEFLRSYIVNPAYAKHEAPRFADGFEKLISRDPMSADAIKRASNLSQIDSGLSPRQAFETMISQGNVGGIDKFMKSIRDHGFIPTVADYASALYAKVVDRTFAASRFEYALKDARYAHLGKAIETMSFRDDFSKMIRELPGAQQSAVLMIRDGVRPYGDSFGDTVSPSLSDALSDALGAEIANIHDAHNPLVNSLNGYLTARRAKGLYNLFRKGEMRNPPVGVSENATHSAIAEFEKDFPQFKEAADKLFTFSRQNFQRQIDAGIVPKSLAKKVLSDNGDYIPFYRDMADELAGGGNGSGTKNGIQSAPFMEMRGSSRDIINPIRSLIEGVAISERVIAVNDVYAAIDRLAKEGGELAGPLWSTLKNSEMRGTMVDIEQAVRNAAREAGQSKEDIELSIRGLQDLIGEDLSATSYKSHDITPDGQRIIFFWQGGERQARLLGDSTLSRDFFNMMTAVTNPEKDMIFHALSAANGFFQGSITHAPRFLIGTLVRDNMTRMFVPRYMGVAGRLPFVQDLVGAYSMMFDKSFYKAWAGGGGIRGGVYAHQVRELNNGSALGALFAGQNFITRTKNELTIAFDKETAAGKTYGVAKAIVTSPLKFMADGLRMIEGAETISRLGVAKMTFLHLKKMGLSDEEALKYARFESRDTLDYNRRGEEMRTFTRVMPFMNAGMQGADRAARGLVGEPVMAAIRAYKRGGTANLDASDKAVLAGAWRNWMAIGSAMGLTAAVYQPWLEETEAHKDGAISPYMHDNYWNFPMGRDEDGNHRFISIHKPYDLPGAFITAAQEFSQEIRKKTPMNWSKVMGALKESLPRQFRSFDDLLGAQPYVKTAFEVALGTKMGFDGSSPRPIVPAQLVKQPIERQITATTSEFAKLYGKTFGVSPIIADHVLNGLGGTLGQDFRDVGTSMFGSNPLINGKDTLNKFFLGQVLRTSKGSTKVGADIGELMAADHGQYQQAAAGYLKSKEGGDPQGAESIYNNQDDEGKAIITLKSTYKQFPPEVRGLDPLIRSETIASVLFPMMRNLGNGQIEIQEKSHKKGMERPTLDLLDTQARQLSTQFNQILAMETRNGLAMVKHEGYEDYPIVDMGDRLKMIRDISPEAGDELEKRLKKAHVLPATGVANVWPEARDRLLKDRGTAHLGDLVLKAKQAE